MTTMTNPNNPALKSWISSANAPDCDFSIQNLPFGIFTSATTAPHVGIAIGDQILDLAVAHYLGLLNLPKQAQGVFAAASLNGFIALGSDVWTSVRAQVSNLLEQNNATLRDNAPLRAQALVAQSAATMLLPVSIPGYTDFYSSKEHATNVGCMFRDPKNALLPNWLEIPIGYNGRASSVVVSDTAIHRPRGQVKGPNMERPAYAPCGKLDFELETGFIIGRGNELGDTIACANAESHIFGMVLLNDWSARDIQAWEYVPLGPFNAKTFGTTISPWVVTLAALEPFRVAQPLQEPEPLAYLVDGGKHNFDIALEVDLQTPGGAAYTICKTNFRHMYWTMAQQLAHHTASGCNTNIGDLMGSGTISGPTPDSFGSLLELTWNGANPLKLGEGSSAIERRFIEDGDTIIMRGWAQGDGYRVGFGECRGKVLPVKA
jgi:fumarylacetoacetase